MIRQILFSLLIATALSAYQADNTQRNKQEGVTAEKQGNSKADLEVLARIRRAITQDKTLSTNAHNVKIVVNGGQVWLRGPVATEAEKDRVVALTKENASDKNVASFLEVKGDKK